MEKKIADYRNQIQHTKQQAGEKAMELLRAGTLICPDLQPFVQQVAGIEQQISAEETRIAEKKAEIEKIKAEHEAEKAAVPVSPPPVPAETPVSPPPVPSATSAAPAPSPRFCTQCGAQLTGGGAFCTQCGAKVG